MKYTDAIELWNNWLLRKIPNSNYWVVMEEFYWYIDYENKIEKVVVPKWFKTNFGSIPKPLRIFFNPTDYIWYILHDYLYSPKWEISYYETTVYTKSYTRKDADLILLETLQLEWANVIEKFSIYYWVRIGWILFYKKKLW